MLEAATELIWESSYGSTSVGAICERAGVNRGSFYHFFESKVALAVAALEEDWRQDSAVFEEIFAPVVPPLERFRRRVVSGPWSSRRNWLRPKGLWWAVRCLP